MVNCVFNIGLIFVIFKKKYFRNVLIKKLFNYIIEFMVIIVWFCLKLFFCKYEIFYCE